MEEMIKKVEGLVAELQAEREKTGAPFVHAAEGKLRAAVADLQAHVARSVKTTATANKR